MDRWSRDQLQPGSLFQRLRETEKRDPGNEVTSDPHFFKKGVTIASFHTSGKSPDCKDEFIINVITGERTSKRTSTTSDVGIHSVS